MFYQNQWFRNKLTWEARSIVRNSNFDRECADDIQQEALIEFAKSLQKNTSLDFDSSRGEYRWFLSTIVQRCCIKAIRQFRDRDLARLNDDFMHPYYEEQTQLEKVIDFHHMARQIPEPYRGIVRQISLGQSVKEIALSRKRSTRTIYRWIDRAVELLKSRYFED